MARSSTNIAFCFEGTEEEKKAARELFVELLEDATGFRFNEDDVDLLEEIGMEWDEADVFGFNASYALVKAFPNNKFYVRVHFDWLVTEGQFQKDYEYDGNVLHCEEFQNPYDFDGTCPECGNEIIQDIWSWTFEEGKTYVCEECGEEIEFDDPELEHYIWDKNKEEILESDE